MTFYGQHDIDRYLASVFTSDTGVYAEIGAYDGKTLSNTLHFAERGWSGLLMEAHKTTAGKCKKNRPESVTIHAAAVGDDTITEATYLKATDILLSGLAPDESKVEAHYDNAGKAFKGFTKQTVPAMTVNAALKQAGFKAVDFITIDTEGTELDVMRGFDLGLWIPRVVVLEINGDVAPYDTYMSRMGYVKAVTVADNVFYANNYDDSEGLQKCHSSALTT